MDNKTFFKTYLSALDKAFENENINDCFYVKSPEDFINSSELDDIENFQQSDDIYTDFFDMIAYYFDAKSHNFPSIQGIEINQYKNIIENKASKIKDELNI